jgi:glycosyltransferase involved in cell wall biosynthesis
MRIGFSLVDLAMGGAQTFFVQLAQGLSSRGHTLTYWLAADLQDRQHVQPALKTSLDAVAEPVRYPWNLWGTDVIHMDGYHSIRRKFFYLPRWRRCVETYHSSYSVERSGPIYPPHCVAVSQAVQSMLTVPSRLIYQGVPLHLADLSSEKRFDVAILGRIHPVKNHRLFLEICASLYRKRGQCSALLIGGHPRSGPYQREIESKIQQLRRQGIALCLTGDVPPTEVWSWLGKARVLLVTSHQEGFGRTAIEAMACEVPVVANPVGGLMEIVQTGETGYLTRKDDVTSFVHHTTQLLENPSLYRSMGSRGRSRVEEHFSLKCMVSAYEDLYREVA